MKKFYLKIGLFVAAIGIIMVLFQFLNFDFSEIKIPELKTRIKSYGLWAPLAFIFIYQIRPFILLPATVASATAGIIWGWEALFYIVIAYSLCATWQFFVGRYFSSDTIDNLIKGKIKSVHSLIKKNAFLSVFIVRLVPNVVFDIQNLAFGMTKVKYTEYILATAIGLLPGTVLLVYFGNSFFHVTSKTHHWWKLILAIVLIILAYSLQKKIKISDFKKGD